MSSIILFTLILTYGFVIEFAKRRALSHIQNSSNVDVSCVYRKRFASIRLSASIIFGIVALFIILSSGNTGVNSSMIGLLMAWGAYQNKQSLPLSGKRPQDIRGDNFILYLRGFICDDYSLTPKDLARNCNNLTFFSEGHFIYLLKQYMPVYAVGMTKELNSPIGAERIYLNDTEWEDEVWGLMERARLIVVLLNDSQSCIWEICKAHQFQEKVIFISNNNDKLVNIRKDLNRLYIYPFPIGLKERTLSYFSEKNKRVQILEYQNTEKDYMQMIKIFMNEKFHLKRFIITQKGMKWGVSIYGVLFFIGWSLFSLVSKLNTSISIMSGIFIFVLSLILPIYLYDKYYSFFRSKRLKKIDKHSSHEE